MKVFTGTREVGILSKDTPRDMEQELSSVTETPALPTAQTGPFPGPAVGKATFPLKPPTSTGCTWAKLWLQRQPWSGSMSEVLASHGLWKTLICLLKREEKMHI